MTTSYAITRLERQCNPFDDLSDAQKLALLEPEDRATVKQQFFTDALDDDDRSTLVELLGDSKPMTDVQWHYYSEAWTSHLAREMRSRDADARDAFDQRQRQAWDRDNEGDRFE